MYQYHRPTNFGYGRYITDIRIEADVFPFSMKRMIE
jgi:hypothetical protein